MAENAEKSANLFARKVGGAGLLSQRIFMTNDGLGLRAVGMVDVPDTDRVRHELKRMGLIEAV